MSDKVLEAPAKWSDTGGRARVFSGHESFAIRYGWLPKLHEAITADPQVFTSDERAILALGLGRNMVKSIRFWGDAFGLTRQAGRKVVPTEFADRLFAADGRDPFLEDPDSLWRLHWNLTVHAGLGAWVAIFQEIQDSEITRERLIDLLRARAETGRGPITVGTATAHADMLIRTYAPSASEGAAVAEETLGCPLQELGLITMGISGGKPVLRFTRGARPSLASGAFAYALHDFWLGTAPTSRMLSTRSLLLDRRSPGVIFRMDENTLQEHLEALCGACRSLSLQEDGVGGLNLVADEATMNELENIAWAK